MASDTGKVVVITGASAGIGAATALALASGGRRAARGLGSAGVRLALAARRLDRLGGVAEQCRAQGADVMALPCDVSKRADVDHLVAETVAKFGRIDVMVANAGYGFLAKVHEAAEEQFDDIVAVNVKGTWYAMQAAAAVMLAQEPRGAGRARRGHIIAVSSGAARRGLPLFGIYAMTKAAQLSLCEAMRVELAGSGVYVSSVHPLGTATEFFDVASAKSRMKTMGLGRMQPAAVVGRKIARLIARPRPELWPVTGSAWGLVLAAAFPRLADRVMAYMLPKRAR